MKAHRTRATETITSLLSEILAEDREPIRLGQRLLDDLHLDSDDFTYWFVPELEERLGMELPQPYWDDVYTVADAIRVVEEVLSRRHSDS